MVTVLLAGAFGGIVRGVVGYVKYLFSYKSVKFNWIYFATMVGVSAFVGVIVTWVIDSSEMVIAGFIQMNPSLAFIIGYVGGDFVENVYKILTRKALLGPLEDLIKKA